MTESKDPPNLRKPSFTIAEIDTFMRRAIARRNGASPRVTEPPLDDLPRFSHDELLETLKTAPELGLSPDDIDAVITEEMKIRSARADVAAILRSEQAEVAATRRKKGRLFVAHVGAFMAVSAMLFAIDKLTTGGTWFFYPVPVWGLAVAGHAFRLIFPKEDAVIAGAANASRLEAEQRAAELEAIQAERRARLDKAFHGGPKLSFEHDRAAMVPEPSRAELVKKPAGRRVEDAGGRDVGDGRGSEEETQVTRKRPRG